MTTMLEKMAFEIHRKIAGLPDDPDLSDCLDAARAALEAIRQADMETGLVGAAEVNKQMRGKAKADYCAAQDSFTAMIGAILNQKPEAPTTYGAPRSAGHRILTPER